MATFTPVTDIWTLGYDQFYRPCWQNKKTGQVSAQPYQVILPPPIGMAQGKKNDAVGSFAPAADMWTYGFDRFDRPCWLNKETQKLHYDSVEGQPPAQPARPLFTPTAPSPQSGPYFLLALPSYVEDIPPTAGKKEKVDEEGQWCLQRNKKGEEYYLNTTTLQWQYETPDCLKKSTRGKWWPG